jgi:IS1 family transposase
MTVIDFTKHLEMVEKQELFRVKRPDRSCEHNYVCVDVDAREVICSSCNARLDPFAHLVWLGDRWERYTAAIDRILRKLNSKQSELERLEADIRNAKARLRRAKR